MAEALEDAARHARARGAPDAAAGLGELARQLTPLEDEEGLRRRSMDAAEYHFDAGDAPRAIALLEEAAASSPPGPGRAELLFRLSSMSWMNLERGVRDPLERALLEAGDDPELLAGIHLDLAWVDIYQGDLAAASDHARRSIDQADKVIDPATKADALSTFGMVEFLSGRPAAEAMSQALELQDIGMKGGSWTEASVYTTPRSVIGLQQMWAGQLDEARTTLEHELAEYERHAMFTVRQEVLCYLAELECRAGRWHVAVAYAAEAMETVVESGQTATQRHVVLFNRPRRGLLGRLTSPGAGRRKGFILRCPTTTPSTPTGTARCWDSSRFRSASTSTPTSIWSRSCDISTGWARPSPASSLASRMPSRP